MSPLRRGPDGAGLGRHAVRTFIVALILLLTWSVTPVAAEGQNLRVRVGGDWHFVLTIKSAGSSWDATMKQDSKGTIKGRAEPIEIDCRAKISGMVKGSAVKMTWQVQSPCSREVMTFKGTMRRNRMTGTYVDSKLGTGTFSGRRDT